MARNYGVTFSVTSPNSATLPAATLISAAAIRPQVYDIVLGSSTTPADMAARFYVSRISTTGTPGSSPTPSPLDPADPASTTTAGLAIFTSTPPTLGVLLLQWAMNQRATFRWVAVPGKELKMPATASNGLAWMNPVVNTTTFLCDGTWEFEE